MSLTLVPDTDIASETGSLWRAISVTKVLSFLCLRERDIWGATIHTTSQLVVKYTTWAMVEVRNEPFLGFTSLACLNNGNKGEFGEFGDLDFSD